MVEQELIQSVNQWMTEMKDEVIQLRRTIHQNPELSFEEYNTSNLIFSLLEPIPEIEVTRPTKTSVLAILKGKAAGKVLAIRSDIDALSLQEQNEIAYKSTNNGIMHACGHDGHAAILVGMVKILAKLKEEINGEIRFIFQHAEEKHPGGAKDLVALGLLDGVDFMMAIHLWIPLPTGKVGLTAGPLMAAPDNFELSIIGKGGHAGIPQEVIDPVVVSAHVITALQALVSRQTNPLQPLVLSLTSIHGGSAYNIIPEKVEIKGTVRTFDQELRQAVPARMENIIQGVCAAFGAKYSFRYELGYDAVLNDHQLVARIRNILAERLGSSSLEEVSPVMVGEDFSAYLKQVSGALLFIGAGDQDSGIGNPHHHPCFNIDEKALNKGLEVLVWSALGLLDRI